MIETMDNSNLNYRYGATIVILRLFPLLEAIEDFMNYIPLDDMEVDYGN